MITVTQFKTEQQKSKSTQKVREKIVKFNMAIY